MVDTQCSTVKLSAIRLDGGTHPRADLSPETIAEYAEAMENGDKLPAVIVFHDGTNHWLADGYHRYKAAELMKLLEIQAEVRHGTHRDALLYSCSANAAHGLRRSNADKRRAVTTLLEDTEWSTWSDREIARRCAVGHSFVSNLRTEVSVHGGQIEAGPRKATRSGTTYPIRTENIGTAKAKAIDPVETQERIVAAIKVTLSTLHEAFEAIELGVAAKTIDPAEAAIIFRNAIVLAGEVQAQAFRYHQRVQRRAEATVDHEPAEVVA